MRLSVQRTGKHLLLHGFLYVLRVLFKAYPKFLHVKKRVRKVRKIPVPTRRTSITGPQTKSSTFEIISANLSIHLPSPFLNM